jgi:hypothetical protein
MILSLITLALSAMRSGSSTQFHVMLESGDHLLLETGEFILME